MSTKQPATENGQIKKPYTPRTGAIKLGCSERKLWELTASGQVQCYRVGRRVFYREEDLDAFIESNLQGVRIPQANITTRSTMPQMMS